MSGQVPAYSSGYPPQQEPYKPADYPPPAAAYPQPAESQASAPPMGYPAPAYGYPPQPQYPQQQPYGYPPPAYEQQPYQQPYQPPPPVAAPPPVQEEHQHQQQQQQQQHSGEPNKVAQFCACECMAQQFCRVQALCSPLLLVLAGRAAWRTALHRPCRPCLAAALCRDGAHLVRRVRVEQRRYGWKCCDECCVKCRLPAVIFPAVYKIKWMPGSREPLN